MADLTREPPGVPATGTGGPLYNYPAVIVGFLLTLLSGASALIQGHGLDDGLQLDEILAIVGPAVTGLLVHFKVYSQATVDKIVSAPENVRRRVHSRNKR